ncbi:short chain dehydrogenase/reductase [Talaromyces proteolyticus]|uniref:Short chain dehydrogenase/reductase n=1 Tax=Talaromyces proteolyticus TaxID=1131652 RepID=A0AAD4KMD0_9EURO|nr:short chain dehydrogenase/reductase [Talaromyces proteolyticus]KAH8694957.1 short chain dehydrogenase/reductase [Talaromyces proteolyticus]
MSQATNQESLFSVKGIVAVITGGGSGLGANIAKALDANGARAVYILGRRADSLKKTADAAVNRSIVPLTADVTSQESLSAAVETIRAREGLVNVLIANSGIIGPSTADLFAGGKTPSIDELQSKLWSTPIEEFTKPLHVNVTGAFYTAVAFLGLLDAANRQPDSASRPKSQVIVVTSIAGFMRNPAAGFAYSASKAAATHMVKQLSTSLAPYKIRCNGIAPGFFPSEMTESVPFMQGLDPRIEGNVSSQICPLERTGSEEDINGLALFLISRAGAYVNGCVQLIDGGRVAIFPAAY